MSTTTSRTLSPPEIRAFVARLRRALWFLPAADRDETLAGVGAHIADSLDAGAVPADVLLQLGTSEAIAEQAGLEFEARTGRAARPAFLNPARVLQLLASSVAIVAFVRLTTAQPVVAVRLDGWRFVGIEQLTWWDTWTTGGGGTSAAVSLLQLVLPVVITLVALLLTGRAWRVGMRFAAYLLAAFILWIGIREGLPSLLTALWTIAPALALEVVAALVPYRARVSR